MIETKKYKDIVSVRAHTNILEGDILENKYNENRYRVVWVDIEYFTAGLETMGKVVDKRVISLDCQDYKISINNKEDML